ncbi:hypothetical protein [Klebsiella aerogenes]|uniref:hypothetical protein n=1 Tax=Klebsiella aerogenes TaxID=548 RepID=UPI0007E410C5|nr:hypothetical protein [Klebsiella aerogenes]
MNNEIEFKFGDYAIIEQKRHGAPNEMYVYKVIGQLRSNKWVDVPVWGVATEILHKELDDVCLCIRCGIDETVVHRYRVKDMQRSSRSPDGGEVTALALTLEKCRELSGCPAGVDLQDWVKQLAAENVGPKESVEHAAGCIAAAEAEGLIDALSETTDERLAGLVHRRLCHAYLEVKNPATDRIVAEAEARGVEKAINCIVQTITPNHETILKELAQQLREGADK